MKVLEKEDILTILEKVELPKNTEALQKEAIKLYKKLSSKYEGSDLYFYLKGKLITKGFSLEDINEVMEDIKKTA